MAPGMVKQLLSCRSGERIRWVGPITTASDSNAFVVVGVDTGTERIIGIPQNWTALLREELLDRARRHECELAASDLKTEEKDLQELLDTIQVDWPDEKVGYDVECKDISIAAGQVENQKLFERFLRDSQSLIVVASFQIDFETLTQLRPLIEDALSQGKSVYISWGYAADNETLVNHKDALKGLEKLQWDSRRNATSGKLVVASAEGQFNSNVLIGDVMGSFEVAVGSFSWLVLLGHKRTF